MPVDKTAWMRERRTDPDYRSLENLRAQNARLLAQLENLRSGREGFDLLNGWKAARDGRALDKSASPDWRDGYLTYMRCKGGVVVGRVKSRLAPDTGRGK